MTTPRCLQTIDTTVQVVLMIGYAIIFPVALLGNSLVLFVVYRHQSLRNALNYLIVNMAIADLLVTLFTMPYSMAYLFIKNLWFEGIFGDVLCRTVHFSLAASIGASIFTLITMTLDRFISIVYVWRKSLTLGSSKLALVLIWVFSFAMFGFYLRLYRVDFLGGAYRCYPKFSDFLPPEFPPMFAICMFVFLYAVPLLLMAVLYSIICHKLFKQKMVGGDYEIDKKKKRVVQMLITCTIFFAICWLPLHVLHYYIYFDIETYRCLPALVILGGFWLGHANSAVNPCLYVIFNRTFRRAFLKALHLSSFDSGIQSHATNLTTRGSRRVKLITHTDTDENENTFATQMSKRFRVSCAKAYAKIKTGSSDDDSGGIDKRKSVVVVSERMTSL